MQIGLIVLVGLAAKNAILIVEFARQREDEGEDPEEAAVEAARTRLRPILMTSFAFILGVVPLVIATGAGAEMRHSLGTAVFSGMLGVTLFGLCSRPCSTSPCAGSAGWAGKPSRYGRRRRRDRRSSHRRQAAPRPIRRWPRSLETVLDRAHRSRRYGRRPARVMPA